jgi:IclR family acetate operon transcriptional repressor
MAARNHIDLVVKTMSVLETLAANDSGMSLKDVAQRVGMVKSSVFRILFTLKETGYVEQASAAGTYRLAMKTAQLARRGAHRPTLATVARPHLERLSEAHGESVWLAVRRNNGVVLVDGVESDQALRLSFNVGDNCPLHATALGKAVAAYLSPAELEAALGSGRLPRLTPRTKVSRLGIRNELETIRAAGYSINDEETIIGAVLVGAPVFDARKRVCGAVSVSVPKARFSQEQRKRVTGSVVAAAEAISRDVARSGLVWQEPSSQRAIAAAG